MMQQKKRIMWTCCVDHHLTLILLTTHWRVAWKQQPQDEGQSVFRPLQNTSLTPHKALITQWSHYLHASLNASSVSVFFFFFSTIKIKSMKKSYNLKIILLFSFCSQSQHYNLHLMREWYENAIVQNNIRIKRETFLCCVQCYIIWYYG